jgi:hypothetical protein
MPTTFLLSAPKEVFTTIILPVVQYGYEAWSLTLREEYRIWVFENRILRRMRRIFRIVGPKSDENG